MNKNKIILFYNINNVQMIKSISTLHDVLAPKDYEIIVTTDIDIQMLAENNPKSAIRIVIFGGDGTVNRVVNRLFELKKEHQSLVMPELILTNMGTGSDYAKSIYGKEHVTCWQKYLFENNLQVRLVDVGMICGIANKKMFHQYFVNILGIGISGEVVRDKNKYEKNLLLAWVPKSMAYIIPAFKNIISYRPTRTCVQVNGESYDFPLKAGFVAKGSYSGGGMKFGLRANLFDGEFDVTLVGDMGLFDLFRNLKSIFSAKIAANNKILSFKTPELNFQFSNPIAIEYDGELLTEVSELKVEIIKNALPVCFNPIRGV